MVASDLAFAFHTLPDFRNICAHDERLYCARVGKNRDKAFPELFRALGIVLDDARLKSYVSSVSRLLEPFSDEYLSLDGVVLSGMGLTREQLNEAAGL